MVLWNPVPHLLSWYKNTSPFGLLELISDLMRWHMWKFFWRYKAPSCDWVLRDLNMVKLCCLFSKGSCIKGSTMTISECYWLFCEPGCFIRIICIMQHGCVDKVNKVPSSPSQFIRGIIAPSSIILLSHVQCVPWHFKHLWSEIQAFLLFSSNFHEHLVIGVAI